MAYKYSGATSALVPISVTSAYTASVNDFVVVDCSSASVTVTLPQAPANMSTVAVKRYDATYAPANTATIAPGSGDAFLGGSTTGAQLPLQGHALVLQYNSSTAQWAVRSTDAPLTQLDTRYLNRIGPSDFGWGGWSHDVAACNSGGSAVIAGNVYLIALPVHDTQIITNVILGVISAGSGLTSGQNFAGLYQNSTLLAATADQSTNWQTTGFKVMALTTPQTVTGSNGTVYAAFFSNGTTKPNFLQAAMTATVWNILEPTSPLVRYAFDSTNTGRTTSLPSTLGTKATTAPFWAAWS